MNTPDWIPPARCGARTVPAGRWFDVVRVPGPASGRVLGRLGWRSGPVVEIQEHGVVHWFVAPRVAAGWPRLPGVRVLGHGHYVAIPPAGWCASPTEGGPPVRWLVPPRGRCLTRCARRSRRRGPGHAVAEHRSGLAPAEPERVVVVTGLEGPLDASEPVTCSYCRRRIVVDGDHAVDCCWRPGDAPAR